MKRSLIALAVLIGIVTASGEAGAQRYARDTATAGQPVVVDGATGLVWQGCAVGQTGNECEGSAAGYTWENALAYCEAMVWGGQNDWRLPNRKELRSIVDNRRVNPSIDTEAFPATPSSYFWSSSSYAYYTSNAWFVDFSNGYVYSNDKSGTYYVRCVRSGP